MQISMTWSGMAALFGSMALLAAMPSVSVLTVAARSASSGFVHGAFTALGIVAADIAFILLAVFGLALLAEALGDSFYWVKYAGGAYLMLLGAGMLWTRATPASGPNPGRSSLISSFMAGLFITFGDQKAVLFYLGFLPAFLDLTKVTLADAFVIAAIAVAAVGGVKLVYAYLGEWAGKLIGAKAGNAMHAAAGGLMIAVGVFLFMRA
jgi:threonine/homoserine/homoserine lactone efflux protein